METVWIKIFVLTLTQCIAPPGKMICQEETVEYRFVNQDDCEHALTQMINVASGADNVIVNQNRSHCRAAAIESEAFSNVDEVNKIFPEAGGAQPVSEVQKAVDFTQSAHQSRLKNMHNCEDVAGVPPCKIGQIIVEAETASETKKAEIWRQQK